MIASQHGWVLSGRGDTGRLAVGRVVGAVGYTRYDCISSLQQPPNRLEYRLEMNPVEPPTGMTYGSTSELSHKEREGEK